MMSIIKDVTTSGSDADSLDLTLSAAPPRYYSYLLRFWEERGETAGQTVWRFSLEDPQTAQRQSFADLNALMTRLKLQIQGPGAESAPADNHEGRHATDLPRDLPPH
jgi:hypothetical protein